MHVQILNRLNTIIILASAVVIALVVFCWYGLIKDKYEVIETKVLPSGYSYESKLPDLPDVELHRYEDWLNQYGDTFNKYGVAQYGDKFPFNKHGSTYSLKRKQKGGTKSPYRRRRR